MATLITQALRVFSRKAESPPKPAQSSGAREPSGNSEISDQKQIASLLTSIRKQRLLVQLLPPAAPAPEASALLACRLDSQLLVFDAPRHLASGLYRPGQPLIATAFREGAELRFDIEVIRIDSFKGRPALYATWPGGMLYRQRRKSFRVRIGKNQSSRLELQDGQGTRARGRLTDLSIHGFGALIDRDAPLREGEEIAVSMELEGVFLSTTVELRDLRTSPMGRYMRIGASFSGLSAPQQSQVEKLIRALERSAIRAESQSGSTGNVGTR